MRRPLIVSIPGGGRCVLAILGQVGARGRGDPGGSEKAMFKATLLFGPSQWAPARKETEGVWKIRQSGSWSVTSMGPRMHHRCDGKCAALAKPDWTPSPGSLCIFEAQSIQQYTTLSINRSTWWREVVNPNEDQSSLRRYQEPDNGGTDARI